MATETVSFVYAVTPVGASGNFKINATGTSTSGTVSFSDADNVMQSGNTFTYNSTTYTFSGTGTSGGFFATSGGTTYYFSDASIAANTNIGSIDTAGTELVCFLAGTMIATPDGEKPIENLAVGEDIVSADGRVLKVKFVSRQTVVPRFHNSPRARPVRIARGALGENLPARDLFVSPGHAILVDGILARAGALVNGTTISQAAAMEKSFIYYNIECDDHELIVAEGLACESFLDEAPRRVFDNYGDYLALYGEDREMKALDLPLAPTARHLPDLVAERLGLNGQRQAA